MTRGRREGRRLCEEVQQAGIAGEVGQDPHFHLRVVRRHQHPPCKCTPADQKQSRRLCNTRLGRASWSFDRTIADEQYRTLHVPYMWCMRTDGLA